MFISFCVSYIRRPGGNVRERAVARACVISLYIALRIPRGSFSSPNAAANLVWLILEFCDEGRRGWRGTLLKPFLLCKRVRNLLWTLPHGPYTATSLNTRRCHANREQKVPRSTSCKVLPTSTAAVLSVLYFHSFMVVFLILACFFLVKRSVECSALVQCVPLVFFHFTRPHHVIAKIQNWSSSHSCSLASIVWSAIY